MPKAHTLTSSDVNTLGLPASNAGLMTDPVDSHSFRIRYIVRLLKVVAWLISLGLSPCSSIVIMSFFCDSGMYLKLAMASAKMLA